MRSHDASDRDEDVGAFAAVPVVDADPWTRVRLLVVGLGGLTVSAMTYGSLFVDGESGENDAE